MRVFAVDPGSQHTGIAVWDRFDDECVLVRASQHEEHDEVLELYFQSLADVLVCERFAARPEKAKKMAYQEDRTSQLIGRLQSAAQDTGRLFILQQPVDRRVAERTPYFAEWLNSKNLGLWASIGPHARSAALHGFYYLTMGKGRNG